MSAPAAAAQSPGKHRGAITVCVMLATVMQALDMTIANVALPYMQGSLSATLDQVNWVLTSYIVASAIMTPPSGWLATRFGRKGFFLFSVTGFTVASVLCAIATSLEEMVVFRLLQGAFGAALIPLSQSILLDSYPKEQQGSAMAIWGMGIMVGPILGPTLGGYLTETYGWRSVFFINLPVGVLAFVGLSMFLHDTRANSKLSFDWFGFVTLSLAIFGFQMMLDRGEQLDWFSSAEIVLEGALGGLCLYLFVVHIFTTGNPFIDPRMFADKNFVSGLLFMFALGAILLATMALMTPYLQQLMGYPVITAGMVLSPRGVGTMVSMMFVGRMINKLDARVMILTGLSLTTFSLWEMSGFTPDISEFTIIWTGVVQGAGFGLIFVPLSTLTFATLAPQFRVAGTALFSLVRNIGSSIGISIVIFMLTRNQHIMHASLSENVTPFNEALRVPGVAAIWNIATTGGLTALDGEISRQAIIVSFANDFQLMMWVTLAAMPLVLLLRKPRAAAAPAPRVAPAD